MNTGRISEVHNPYDGSVIDTVVEASTDDVEQACKAAYDALDDMSAMTAYERSNALFEAWRRLGDERERLASLVCQEVGKTICEARGEIGRAMEVVRLASEEAKRFAGEQIPFDGASNGAGKTGFFMYVPAGVVAAIVPFNFPMVLTAHKLAPALAAGNSVVLKPPPQAPLAACQFATIFQEAGFPDGAVNVVPGGAKVGDALVRNNRVGVVAFGGSDRTGEIVARAAGMKRLLLECGSTASVTIMETGYSKQALDACVRAGYSVAGQMCIHMQRLFVQNSIFDEVRDEFVQRAGALVVGDPRKEDTDVGPMIDVAAAERVESWIQEAVADGATVVTGARRDGNLFSPTVLTGVKPDMKVFAQEVFGPVVSIIGVADVDEAIELTNATDYGLNTGIFTNRLDEALPFVRRVHHGSVFVNEVSAWRADIMPYGGVKRSGIGREGIRYAMEAMSEKKVVSMQLPPVGGDDEQ
ncbi:MAG: aldehyde dehydrogenase family protein [Armatimonadota bacterium]